MHITDPYTPDRHYYECRDCLRRAVSDEARVVCEACGGRLQNLAVARE